MPRNLLFVFVGCAVLALSLWGQEKHSRVGRAPSAEELRRWGTTILPDGTGLPQGSGNASQGKKVYRDQCAGCHGDNGEGHQPLGPRLVGGIGSLRSADPIQTVGSYWPYATTVWDYTYRAMPYAQPGTLSVNDTYAVTAYLLYLNGIILRDEVMDRETLPKVKMPNREGFIPDPRPDVTALVRH
jgi:mono/diheme cytochrome c family protein